MPPSDIMCWMLENRDWENGDWGRKTRLELEHILAPAVMRWQPMSALPTLAGNDGRLFSLIVILLLCFFFFSRCPNSYLHRMERLKDMVEAIVVWQREELVALCLKDLHVFYMQKDGCCNLMIMLMIVMMMMMMMMMEPYPPFYPLC
jgi:hypothetical protein